MISYEDGVAAMEWLTEAFGFEERKRILHEGRLSHGEMETGAGVIMLASPTSDYESPGRHRAHCEPARRWSEVPWVIDGILVYVDKLDEHYRRSKEHGARILSGIQPGPPARQYRAEDLEGHRWMFMERTADNVAQ